MNAANYRPSRDNWQDHRAGLILAANDEAELAGTLAHAMAHIAARQGTRLATRERIAQLSQSTQQATIRRTSPEADRLAVSMTAAAGYDPDGLAHYIGRVQKPTHSVTFSALPPREDRVQTIEHAIQALPAKS